MLNLAKKLISSSKTFPKLFESNGNGADRVPPKLNPREQALYQMILDDIVTATPSDERLHVFLAKHLRIIILSILSEMGSHPTSLTTLKSLQSTTCMDQPITYYDFRRPLSPVITPLDWCRSVSRHCFDTNEESEELNEWLIRVGAVVIALGVKYCVLPRSTCKRLDDILRILGAKCYENNDKEVYEIYAYTLFLLRNKSAHGSHKTNIMSDTEFFKIGDDNGGLLRGLKDLLETTESSKPSYMTGTITLSEKQVAMARCSYVIYLYGMDIETQFIAPLLQDFVKIGQDVNVETESEVIRSIEFLMDINNYDECERERSARWFRQSASKTEVTRLNEIGLQAYITELNGNTQSIDSTLVASHVKSILQTKIPNGLFPESFRKMLLRYMPYTKVMAGLEGSNQQQQQNHNAPPTMLQRSHSISKKQPSITVNPRSSSLSSPTGEPTRLPNSSSTPSIAHSTISASTITPAKTARNLTTTAKHDLIFTELFHHLLLLLPRRTTILQHLCTIASFIIEKGVEDRISPAALARVIPVFSSNDDAHFDMLAKAITSMMQANKSKNKDKEDPESSGNQMANMMNMMENWNRCWGMVLVDGDVFVESRGAADVAFVKRMNVVDAGFKSIFSCKN